MPLVAQLGAESLVVKFWLRLWLPRLRTVPKHLNVNSLHSYFLLAGESGVEILYEVDSVRDGKSFATRIVKAMQRNRAIFQVTVSFHANEWGPSFQTPGRELEAIARARGIDKEYTRRFPTPDELLASGVANEHIVGADNQGEIDTLLISKGDWWSLRYFRHRLPLPDDLGIHVSVFAWMSDATLAGICCLPHLAGPEPQSFDMVFSLDHSIHYHRPFRADEWLLFHTRTTVSAGARGLARNEVFTLDGVLVATVMQEALFRVPKAVAAKKAIEAQKLATGPGLSRL